MEGGDGWGDEIAARCKLYVHGGTFMGIGAQS